MSDRDTLIQEHFRTTVARDFAYLFIGARLGGGAFREVFVNLANTAQVIKVEECAESFSNVAEWQVWEAVKDTEHARWFAPCVAMSACGTVMIQARTKPVEKEDLPAEVPAFFTDLKPMNWGRLGDRIVCHDYGFHRMLERGMTKRMRKADW